VHEQLSSEGIDDGWWEGELLRELEVVSETSKKCLVPCDPPLRGFFPSMMVMWVLGANYDLLNPNIPSIPSTWTYTSTSTLVFPMGVYVSCSELNHVFILDKEFLTEETKCVCGKARYRVPSTKCTCGKELDIKSLKNWELI